MSNSSDGRPPAPPQGRRPPPPPRHADPRQLDPETRADLRYGADPRRPAAHPADRRNNVPAPAGWQQTRQPDNGPYGYDERDDEFDPRTGPSTFEFHPTPLQPRNPDRVPIIQPSQERSAERTYNSARQPRPHADAYDDTPLTGPPAHPGQLGRDHQHQDAFRHAPDAFGDGGGTPTLSAPSRSRRSSREMAHAPIVPAGSVTGRSLTLVVAIMCFLACLTAGAVYLMIQSAEAWRRDIASEVTVQVEARAKLDVDAEVARITAFLARQPGIVATKPLSLNASGALLEPWLGQSEALLNLPVPRLIAVEIDRDNPPDFPALRSALDGQFKGTSLDDHRHWQQQIRTVTRSFALGGLAILILVGAATTAIIVSATRSALASNREIVEVLHFVGATDRFIASQFQRHFLSLGIRAGVVGATFAGLAFLCLPIVMNLLGGGSSASLAELQHLVGSGTLDPLGYGWLAVVVVVISGLCMLTSRIGVYRILHSQH